MELATPHTEEVIKFVDKVGGLEWLIQKCEIDGATSFKLDLSLDTPVIIIPYNSMSKKYVIFAILFQFSHGFFILSQSLGNYLKIVLFDNAEFF